MCAGEEHPVLVEGFPVTYFSCKKDVYELHSLLIVCFLCDTIYCCKSLQDREVWGRAVNKLIGCVAIASGYDTQVAHAYFLLLHKKKEKKKNELSHPVIAWKLGKIIDFPVPHKSH